MKRFFHYVPVKAKKVKTETDVWETEYNTGSVASYCSRNYTHSASVSLLSQEFTDTVTHSENGK